MSGDFRLKLKAQLYCGAEIAMGPGKAELLEAIVQEHSISAAARALGMSYRRAWMLVDVMNRCWSGPLVDSMSGGARGGGAVVTPLGQEILRHYRALEAELDMATHIPDYAALAALIAPMPRR